MPPRSETDAAALTAMLSAGAMIAHQVGGKATRDALFLSHFDVTTLPLMLIGAAAFSIAVVLTGSRAMTAFGPARLVPPAFGISGALMLGEWGLAYAAPAAAAVAVYLHMAGLGAFLISGFWSVVNERFDPRTAKKRIGRIAGGATLGGLAGGLLAERVAATLSVEMMLPILALLHLFCAWMIRGIRTRSQGQRGESREAGGPYSENAANAANAAHSAPSVVQIFRQTPYLRNLAALVLLTTVSGAGIDYVFKVHATAAIGRDENLLRFFAVFYTATGLLTFLVQTFLARPALEKLGLGRTVGTLPWAVMLGGAGALAVPGLASAAVAGGMEAVTRSSLFRSAYELLYTPIPAREKRAAKSVIDVGFDRLGDALGGGMIQLLLLLGPVLANSAILAAAVALGLLGLGVASLMNQGYVAALEKNLLTRAEELDLSEVEDSTTRSALLQSLGGLPLPQVRAAAGLPLLGESEAVPRRLTKSSADMTALATPGDLPATGHKPPPPPLEPVVQRIVGLRSGDREQVLAVLREEGPMDITLVPQVIPLLAWDAVSQEAAEALRRVAPRIEGQLTDALLDASQEFAIRRRIPRVLEACGSQRAADGLLASLADKRFEVRLRCGWALASLQEKNQAIRIPPEKAFEAVLREVNVGKRVWESQRLLDRLEGQEDSPFVDEFLRERASRSLQHVFTLLSLALPKEPLQIAFRGLHTDDDNLRGTALEYLESLLPPEIHERLWPFLEAPRRKERETQSREAVLASLLRSNQSISLNLAELRKQWEGEKKEPGAGSQKQMRRF